MNNIVPFEFDANEVRVVEQDGEAQRLQRELKEMEL